MPASGITLLKTPVNLDTPWGMTWLDDNNLLITQKSGEIFLINTEDYTQTQIKHDIPSVQYGQGGLLDIINDKNVMYGLLVQSKKMASTLRRFIKLNYLAILLLMKKRYMRLFLTSKALIILDRD